MSSLEHCLNTVARRLPYLSDIKQKVSIFKVNFLGLVMVVALHSPNPLALSYIINTGYQLFIASNKMIQLIVDRLEQQ